MASIEKRSRRVKRLSSLDAMKEEIGHQVEDLPSFSAEMKHHSKNRRYDTSQIVFTGSGDSYASSLLAHYLSGGLAAVADPYELHCFPSVTRNKTVFITSITGRTSANIELARRIQNIARLRIAVTANQDGRLAGECDERILLKYRTLGILTSGTISFTSSIVALATQIQPLARLGRLDVAMKRAVQWSESVKLRQARKFVFIGSGIGYALAAYGAFKIHEVLGLPADYQYTEQLGHSQLFSLDRSDKIICLALGHDQKTADTYEALHKFGFGTYLFRVDDQPPVVAALETSFALQHLALRLARNMRRAECAFLTDHKRLNLSSRLIY